MRRIALGLLLVGAVPSDATAAARARDGGTLRLAVLPEVRADRWGDTPEGAVLRSLVAAPLCRLDAGGRVQPVLATFQRSADAVSVIPRPGARSPSGTPVSAAELVRAWARALERSPVARAALAPVRDLAATLEQHSRGRGALVRSFVGAPATAMPGLLPPALGGPDRGTAVSSPTRGSGTAVLMYATDRPAQRAVAQRLQILLRDAGVQLTLAPRTPEALDRDWRAGQADLALRSVLLPPVPAGALGVVLELAGDVESRRELAPLGAVADTSERAARARERALQLAATLPVLPLYAEGLRARVDPSLVDVRRDGFGLWMLDDAWWP